MTIHEFRKLIDIIDDSIPDYSDKKVTVVLAQSSIGATASSEVVRISTGIDWDSGQVMLHTAKRLIEKK